MKKLTAAALFAAALTLIASPPESPPIALTVLTAATSFAVH